MSEQMPRDVFSTCTEHAVRLTGLLLLVQNRAVTKQVLFFFIDINSMPHYM